ncbi:MAG TPA: hypothetical protein VFD48_12755 [Pyrinomonadaceae bacterium]|nr:hypothetical protein [Pyrinomonadaceae bacterium]
MSSRLEAHVNARGFQFLEYNAEILLEGPVAEFGQTFRELFAAVGGPNHP